MKESYIVKLDDVDEARELARKVASTIIKAPTHPTSPRRSYVAPPRSTRP